MCSLCRLPVAKNQNFGQILTFWGFLYRPPFTDEGPIWCAIADPRSTPTCQISSRSVYSVALWRQKKQFLPHFAIFWTSTFSDVASWQQSEKIDHGCTTTNLPLQTFSYPTVSKPFLYSNAFMAKSGAQSLTFTSVTNKQGRQTKNSTFLAAPSAGKIRAPPNLAW